MGGEEVWRSSAWSTGDGDKEHGEAAPGGLLQSWDESRALNLRERRER